MNFREDFEFARNKTIPLTYAIDVIFPKIQREQEIADNTVTETFYPVVGYLKRLDDIGMDKFLEEQELKKVENEPLDNFNKLFAKY